MNMMADLTGHDQWETFVLFPNAVFNRDTDIIKFNECRSYASSVFLFRKAGYEFSYHSH